MVKKMFFCTDLFRRVDVKRANPTFSSSVENGSLTYFFKSLWLRPIYDIVVLCTGNTSFYCTSQIFFFFTNWRFVATPILSKSMSTIFPTAFTHFTSLCPILLVLTVFQTFSLLWYLLCDLWSMIFITIAKRLWFTIMTQIMVSMF